MDVHGLALGARAQQAWRRGLHEPVQNSAVGLEAGQGSLGADRIALRRLDDEVLQRVTIGDDAPIGFMPDPGDQAAILGHAREGMMDLLLVHVAHVGKAAEADAIGGHDPRRPRGERPISFRSTKASSDSCR